MGLSDLRAELARVGIRRRLARRIELELADHLACDPSAQLGEPRLIAERFGAELRLPATRRATFHAFGALALTALALGVAVQSTHIARGWPAVPATRSLFVSLGGLAIVFGVQVALVAGVLALSRVLRRTTAGDLRLVQRRVGLALAGGAVVLAGQGVQAAALQPLQPTWWLFVAVTALAVPAFALGVTAHELRSAVAVTMTVQPARRAFPRPLVVALGLGVVALVCIGSAFAEHSWNEGLTRGAFEAVAFAGCFAAFGRYVGLRH
jgi:hypothetical protein